MTSKLSLLTLLLAGCVLGPIDGPGADPFEATQHGMHNINPPGLTSDVLGGDSIDSDGDGIIASLDCDDDDERIGMVLYDSELAADEGDFTNSPKLPDPWEWDGNSARATVGGQQALLGQDKGWENVVVYADITAGGTEIGCGFDCYEECREYVPEDCYTEAEALGLGILSAKVTGSGVLTLSNDGDYDVCLNSYSMWYNPSSQAVSLGDMGESGDPVRVPAGGSVSTYYGSWTTDNGSYEAYLGEDAFWCNQLGTVMTTGYTYQTDGAVMPDDMAYYIETDTDEDGDGVEDHVDWASSYGVQAQYNIWDYQASHAAVSVGKLANAELAGTLEVTLALHNRGAVAATDVVLTDTIPRNWTLVGCDVEPDSETYNDDDTTTLTWTESLAGCTSNCSVVDELVITCELTHSLGVDVRNVYLPEATVAYFDGDDDEVSTSRAAHAFDYDHNGDESIMCGETDRWRGGILLRAQEDADQDEGYHGYRCALAQNPDTGCHDPGHFLQLGEFMDMEEDDIQSECDNDCPPNTTFEQIGRDDHEGTIDISNGDAATLMFWAYEDNLYCKAEGGEGNTIASIRATDDSLTSGGVGFSTLNLYGDFEHITVCAALDAP